MYELTRPSLKSSPDASLAGPMPSLHQVRMDALLVRQFNLIECFTNTKTAGSGGFGTSGSLMGISSSDNAIGRC